ncbi:hypothetical protein [Nonomuraea sp. SYSU D8015]|uniref:hypothetical protein n=1 Tax=Nonomuraea sp. SYSU D8015 TaxID=2593644 RepID=UPI0016612BD6|nr:hypothetical protein [Nonomuraea sp. SYSU D8015]
MTTSTALASTGPGRTGRLLTVILAGQFMAILDATIVTIAAFFVAAVIILVVVTWLEAKPSR